MRESLLKLCQLVPTKFNHTTSEHSDGTTDECFRACVDSTGVIHVDPTKPLDWRIAGWCFQSMQGEYKRLLDLRGTILKENIEKQYRALDTFFYLTKLRDVNREDILRAYIAYLESQQQESE